MTKEELKKEAEEKAKKRTKGFKCQDNCEKSYVMGALDFAEPREKQIAELEEEVTRLRNENLDIINKYTRFAETDRRTIAELEAQIEKMKCCEMCKHKNLNWEFSPICEARDKIKIENPLTCKCDKWEIKENDR